MFDYRRKMDILGGFFKNSVSVEADKSVTVKDLYDAYTKFCEDNGESVKERLGKKNSMRGWRTGALNNTGSGEISSHGSV